jgi:hypothetical protein
LYYVLIHVNPRYRPEITLGQNKHMLRASRGNGAPQNYGHKAIYLISQILHSKTHIKSIIM